MPQLARVFVSQSPRGNASDRMHWATDTLELWYACRSQFIQKGMLTHHPVLCNSQTTKNQSQEMNTTRVSDESCMIAGSAIYFDWHPDHGVPLGSHVVQGSVFIRLEWRMCGFAKRNGEPWRRLTIATCIFQCHVIRSEAQLFMKSIM